MNTNIIALEDMENLAIAIGINPNPHHDCFELAVIIGNIKSKELAEKIGKVVHDMLWEEFNIKDAKNVKAN